MFFKFTDCKNQLVTFHGSKTYIDHAYILLLENNFNAGHLRVTEYFYGGLILNIFSPLIVYVVEEMIKLY